MLYLAYATRLVCYWSKTMRDIILTRLDVEFLANEGHFFSFLEKALTLLIQLNTRQCGIGTGIHWPCQLLDGCLERWGQYVRRTSPVDDVLGPLVCWPS
jgi:hypothetical protein